MSRAYILPRVDVSMPKRWIEENPDELLCADNGARRECFASEKWLRDVSTMLKEFIGHIESSDYSENIVGYQLCGGNTQEWFPFVTTPVSGKAIKDGFAEFIRANYPEEEGRHKELPDKDSLGCESASLSQIRYYEYLSYISSSALCRLSSYVKELTCRRVVVGCFYGYTLECPDPRLGHHGLDRVLACPDIDFIASPISYSEGRLPGTYMSYMSLTDSIRLHGKLYFSECDIRTHLTIRTARPGCVEPGTYRQPIWLGSPDPEIARAQVRAAFIKALTTESALCTLDPAQCAIWPLSARRCAERSERHRSRKLPLYRRNSYRLAGPTPNRSKTAWLRALGYTGAPCDIYSVTDFASVVTSARIRRIFSLYRR